MATAVWDRQYAGMESRESFQRSGPADREGICLGNEKFINFAYWIGGEGYSSSSGISANRFRYVEILGITIAGAERNRKLVKLIADVTNLSSPNGGYWFPLKQP